MNRKSLAVALICLVSLGFGAWAESGTATSNGLVYNYTAQVTTPKRISPNNDVLQFFVDNGIDASYVNLLSKYIPTDVNDEIDSVVKDNKDELEDLIWSNLRVHLAPGVAEVAYMEIGRNSWELSLN